MRLPTLNNDYGKVNEPLAIDMIRYAIDHGVNYVDSAHVYHGGNSERVIGKALKDGYREKVRIATKLPTWAVKQRSDFDRLLNEQLERLQVKKIDFYLLHNLKTTLWGTVRDLGVREWLDKIKADGRAGEVGFSFHDGYDMLTEIIGAYDGWAMCQIQYNYMNERVQAGTKGLKYAADKGLAVAIMEPILGGCLAAAPEPVQRIFDSGPTRRTPADWALQWVWNKPQVSVVLRGMSAMQHVVENVESANRSAVGSLTKEDLRIIARVRKKYESLRVVPCTRCGYCMPCPTGLDIPHNMQLYTDALAFKGNQLTLNRNLYRGLPEKARAGACEACRKCEEKCPQKIIISEWMPKIHAQFSK
jgi:predicted aldo/keto reductase-like oxidoreductase